MVLALIFVGAGLVRVTSAGITAPVAQVAEQARKISHRVPFTLLLSAPATEVQIDAGQGPQIYQPPLRGTLVLDPGNPNLTLTVKWQNPATPGEHRFAKLTLEAHGQPTFVHVFDGTGDLDDFLELPLPARR